jgi:hypothetical protein
VRWEADLDYCNAEEGALVQSWALSLLLRHVSLDNVLTAVGLLLTEVHVIVVGATPGALTAAVLGLSLLLRPLRWSMCNVIIPTVPDGLALDLVDAPTPNIIGVSALPPGFELQPGKAVLQLADDRLRQHLSDKLEFGSRKLPQVPTYLPTRALF